LISERFFEQLSVSSPQFIWTYKQGEKAANGKKDTESNRKTEIFNGYFEYRASFWCFSAFLSCQYLGIDCAKEIGKSLKNLLLYSKGIYSLFP